MLVLIRRKKQRQEYAAKISGSEDNVPDDLRDHVEIQSESKTRLVKNGHTYKVILTWRGKTYMVQMFVPSVSRPTRQDVEKEIQKIYPDAKLMSFLPKDLEPGEPTVMMGEELDKKDKPFVKKLVGKLRKGSKTHAKQADDLEKAVNEGKKYKRDEYGDPIKPDGSYAGKKNEDKNPKDEKITRSESYSVNRKQQAAIAIAKLEKKENDTVKKKLEKNSYEPDTSLVEGTPAWQRKEGKSESGGLNAKGVASYRAANPGSKLKTAVTTKPSKLKKGSKAANRRKSFCSRMKGMKSKLTSAKTARDPDSRINKSLRKWNCSFEPENGEVLSETMIATIKRKVKVLGGGSNKKPAPKTTGRDAGAIAKKVLQQKQHNKYVNFLPMDEAKKKCGEGEYYCNDDKKCKPIPKGYRIGYGGYLKPENKEDESNGKKGGSNGNGNGHGGNGNGHGGNGNGGNGGGNGGGE